MKIYVGRQEITPLGQVWINNLAGPGQIAYDFVAAGYPATINTPLINPAFGSMYFSMVDSYGNVPKILIGGNPVSASGIVTALAFMLTPNVASDHDSAYMQWVYDPAVTPPGQYVCTAQFSKTGGQNSAAFIWTILLQ